METTLVLTRLCLFSSDKYLVSVFRSQSHVTKNTIFVYRVPTNE